MKQLQNVTLSSYAESAATLPPQVELVKSVEERYAYWRLRILYSMIFGYAAFYLVRQNQFSLAIPSLSAEFGYTKTQLGAIITIWSIVYGVGKFVNGYFSDRSNARYFMTIGLLGSALTCCILGFGTSLYFFGFFFAINAWFQSMGWPPVARLLAHWFSPAELGTKWGFTIISHQLGGAVITFIASWLILNYGWQSSFIVPSMIVVGIALFLFNRLRDTPESIGLPSIEQHHGLTDAAEEGEDEHLTPKALILRVMNNRLLWYVCLANMFFYVVRLGIVNWAPTFLRELKGASLMSSGWQVIGYDIAGMFGGIAAGWISDYFFKGRRGPVSVLYMTLLIVCLCCLWLVPAGNDLMSAFTMMVLGFLVYGPQVLAGVASADIASKKAVGMANGLTGTFAYLGSALSGICVGWIADHYGWNGGFMFFVISALLSTFFFSLTWGYRSKVLEELHEDLI
ncbi:MAG: MFS transporter [Alphaproteobacteria bacterium]|nr:MFS transporter [Alphaproteobacteria bacterium]